MTFAVKNRYGDVIGVSLTSSAGGASFMNISASNVDVTLANGGGVDLGRPCQVINNTAGGAIAVRLPAANQSLGLRFYILEDGGAQGLNITADIPAGVIRDLGAGGSCVVTCLNDGANTGAAWYVTG